MGNIFHFLCQQGGYPPFSIDLGNPHLDCTWWKPCVSLADDWLSFIYVVHYCLQVRKALELYEQLRQRMGVVVVGPSGSGKSTLWKTLKLAMAKTNQVVKQYVMNPKAMPRTQLLGNIDMDTREWTDGVLTFAARQVVKEPQGWLLQVVRLISRTTFLLFKTL